MLLTHGDSITELGTNLQTCAVSSSQVIAGIWNEKNKIFGVQFHPEVDLTPNGMKMMSNFLFGVCGAEPSFTIDCRKEQCIKYIRETVGNSKVLALVSGGVDSTVCVALLKQALPVEQIFAVHIDNGEQTG